MLTLLNLALIVVIIVLIVANFRNRKTLSYERSLFYKNKMDKAFALGKSKFIFIEVIAKRFLPVIIILELICNSTLTVGSTYISDAIKIILACIIGYIVGNFQWNMLIKISTNTYVETKYSTLMYLLVNGSLAWGIVIGIAYVSYPAYPLYYAVVQIIFFGIVGLIYGFMDFANHTKNLNSYRNYSKTKKKKK